MVFARNRPMTDFAPSSASFRLVLVKFVPVVMMSPIRMMSFPSICSLLKRKSSAGLVFPVAMCCCSFWQDGVVVNWYACFLLDGSCQL